MSVRPSGVGTAPATPLKPKFANCDPDAGPPTDRKTRFTDHAKDMEGTWVGPLTIEQFSKAWFSDIVVDSPDPVFTSIPMEGSVEEPFVNAILENGLCKNLFPKDSHSAFVIDPTTNQTAKPDVVFLSEDIPFDKTHKKERLARAAGLCDMFFDFKFGSQDKGKDKRDENDKTDPEDPFGYLSLPQPSASGDPSDSGTPSDSEIPSDSDTTSDTDTRVESRGQLVSYANLLGNTGHRLHFYCAVIMRDDARFIRFDRSGAVYTEAFKWRTTNILANFIRTVDAMTPEQRGWDPSVERLPKDSPLVSQAWDIANEQAKKVLPSNLKPKDVIPDPTNKMRLLCLIHVFDEPSKSVHRLIVGNPHSLSYTFVGRGTRGFLAIDLDEGTIVYLKDTWRLAFESMLKESDTYQTLRKHHVPNLPDYLIGGDVPVDWKTASDPTSTQAPDFQYSLNWDYVDAEKQRRAASNREYGSNDLIEVEPHTHHRVVMKKIGQPLKEYKSSKQLVCALRDALVAHDKAATAAAILHRDLSNRNVMFDKDGRGMLLDWDMAANYSNKESSVQRRKSRTGTFRFMSTNILGQVVGHVHSACDDMESLVHILFFTVLSTRRLPPHESGYQNVWRNAFLQIWNPTGAKEGNRLNFLRNRGELTPIMLQQQLQPPVLVNLMLKLRDTFSPIYDRVDDARASNATKKAIEKKKLLARGRLKDAKHLLAIFKQHLDTTKFGSWPPDDAADKKSELYIPPRDPERLPTTLVSASSKKRKRSSFDVGAGNITKVSRENMFQRSPHDRQNGKDAMKAEADGEQFGDDNADEQSEAGAPSEPAEDEDTGEQAKMLTAGQKGKGRNPAMKAKGRNTGAKATGRTAGAKATGRTAVAQPKAQDTGRTTRSRKAASRGAIGVEPPQARKYGRLRMNLRSRPADPPSSETER